MIDKQKAVFSEGNRTYDTGSDCDESNASGQMVVKVAAPTSTMVAADRVILGRGTAREEEGVIDSVSADASITLLANLVYNHTVTQEQTLDQESAAAQKNVYITATANLLVGETVVMSAGEAEEESGVIDAVVTDNYITLVDVLANTHAIARKCKHTAPTGIGVVEVIMLTESTVIDKSHCKRIAISLPSTWQTAGITFLGCNTPDGTFTQIVKATDIAEIAIASVVASKTIGMDGIVMQTLEAVPFIKLRSGVAATPVDQKAGKIITVMLME
ncbi:hypothetical protein KAX08_05720 [candidate division WOR-3 bacterium]|nr:hypothetical protein [candidate division WOR-3 bacterium]